MIAMSVIALLLGGFGISQEKLEWTLVIVGLEFIWNLIGCDLGFAAQPRYEILSNSEMVKR